MTTSKLCPSLLSPWEGEDPAFRRTGRLPNLRYGDQVRAVWVTRYDFHTDSDVMRIMHQSAQAGFNTVFFQVRGNASTYFSSKIEPWSECYDWKSPGFDPLRLAIKEAHSQNMALHAWINVMPMWRGMSPPSNPDHMYVRHPQWSWFDAHGTRQPLNTGFYVSVNPCLPEVRKHIMGICQEIVADYEVDGLHLDYIRFPNEHPVLHGHQYPRDQRTLELFKEATGLGPEDKPSVWDQWRCDCVTALLRDIRRTAKSLRPQLVLSAAVAVDRKEALSRFQDVEQWVKERLLDAVVPMNYTICHKTFRLRVERDWAIEVDRSSSGLCTKKLPLRKRPKHPKGNRMAPEQFVKEAIVEDWAPLPAPAVIMGTSVESGDCRLHQKQLALALQRFGHFSVFCYSSLFSPTSRAVEGNNSNNNNRQTSLLSFLKILSDASKLFTSLDHSTNSSRNLQQQHPFRAFDLWAHPEEALQFDDRVDFRAPLALPPVAKVLDLQPYPDHRDIQKFGRRRKKPGGRYVISITGEIVKLNRRTFRKSLAAKLEKKECFLDAAVKERGKLNIISAQAQQQQQQCTSVASSFSSPSSTTKQPAKLGPYVAMDNWEAVKMLEATASEKKKMAEPLTDCKHGGDLQLSENESYSSKSAVFFVPCNKKPKVIRLTTCR